MVFDYGTAYTDANGHFYISEQYRKNRNVNIIFIFENNNVNIRTIKGLSFWQMFFTERNNIGEYENSALENINYLFTNNPGTSQADLNTQQKRFWIAAHAINSVYEQRANCLNAGIFAPPTNLNMWITNQNTNGNALSKYASAPMFKQIGYTSNLVNFAQLYLVVTGSPVFAIAMEVLLQFPPDITYNYSENEYYYEYSDMVTQIFYHELCHASHYKKVGNNYWLTLGIAEVVNGAANPPYGLPTDLNAGRIALCESWAEFCSAEFAHMKYGTNNSGILNPISWSDYLEKFKPYGFGGYWRWIPDGIMYDLIDDTFEPGSTVVIDSPYGFTISQIFSSLDDDVVTMQQ